MNNTISNISDVFNIFPTNVRMADALGVGPSTVSEMKRRGSIPVEYWPVLVDAAKSAGRQDLTLERMAIVSAEAALEKRMARESAI
jgi:hypothetical protein